MDTMKLSYYGGLLLLLAVGISQVFAQQSTILPPVNQQTERKLVFGDQLSGDDCQYAISMDGSLLAIVNIYQLQVWDLTTKQLLIKRELDSQNALPRACSFSPSGQQVIIHTGIGDLVVFDLNTRDYTASWSAVPYASQGLKFAVQDNGGYGKVFTTDESEGFNVQVHSDVSQGIAFSPNERFLLVGSPDKSHVQILDLVQRETAFVDTIMWQYQWQPAICNNGRRIGMSKWPRSSELVVATFIRHDSAFVTSTQLAGDLQKEEIRFTFSHDGRYLCVISTQGNFRVYDCDNDFAIVYEDTSVRAFSDNMIIDSTYITYGKRDHSKIVLDQRSLQVVDTLTFSEGLALFDPQHRPVHTLTSGRTLKYYNDNTAEVESLKQAMLDNCSDQFSDRISSNLMTYRGYRRVGTLAKFDLMNLEHMNIEDSLEKHNYAEIRPDMSYWDIYRRNRKVSFSPRWKYKIQDTEISSWATGEKIMDLPFLATRAYNWQIVYTYEEDRVMFFDSDDKRLIVADLSSGQLILDQNYDFLVKKVSFSPTGNFVAVVGNNTSSLKVEWLNGQALDFEMEPVYDNGRAVINMQISPNGEWLQLYTYGKSFSEKVASIWSTGTGKLVYQANGRLVLIDSPTDVLHWSADSLKRVSIVTEEVRWSIPFKGECHKMRAPVSVDYFTYVKDGIYYCLADLTTGQELWQMGIRGGIDNKYFVKSSQYPIVHTNYPPFLAHFHYEDSSVKETFYPTPESLQDSSQYLQRITRQVLK